MKDIADIFRTSNAKITFGLQKHQIDYIESELQRWVDMDKISGEIKVNPKYIRYVWEKLGKELNWCPFSLALYYFEYLDDL